VYAGLFVVFAASYALADALPAESLLRTVAGNVGVAALIGALFQLLRDHAAHEIEVWLRRDDQQFHVGVTSHMANMVFDKHVAFCEEYMAEVQATVDKLIAEHASPAAIEHANRLYEIRRRHATWVTTAMSQRLEGFEFAVRKLGAKAQFIDRTAGRPIYADARSRTIEKVAADFERILPRLFDEVGADDAIASETVIQRVREILDIERLVELRIRLIGRAHASLH